MPHPASKPQPFTPAWHAAEEAVVRAWLDQWARLHLIPVLEHPEPPTAATVPPLATLGSH